MGGPDLILGDGCTLGETGRGTGAIGVGKAVRNIKVVGLIEVSRFVGFVWVIRSSDAPSG